MLLAGPGFMMSSAQRDQTRSARVRLPDVVMSALE
jgi:hypothetical protein